MAELKERYVFDWHRIFAEDKPHVEYCITDICDRNCKSCSHLAPLAKEANFVGTEEFTRVVTIMRRVLPDVHTFWLTGGEPTLHPEHMKLLAILREIYPDVYVGIYSNGRTMRARENDEAFWEFVRSRGIVWGITNYDTPKEYFEELFASRGCGNDLAIVQPGRTFARLTDYSDGQPVTREKYEKCGWERSKINIRNGKIYNCPSAEFADLFTGYFGDGPFLTEKDYLLVDERLTREAIERFRGPTPMCAHCDISRRRETFPNAPSERKREEWSETRRKQDKGGRVNGNS